MLGKGLESLIPAGGYKKPDDPSTSSGQAPSVDLSQTGLGQVLPTGPGQAPLMNSGQASSTENESQYLTAHSDHAPHQPAHAAHQPVISQSIYSGEGYQSRLPNVSTAPQPSPAPTPEYQRYSPEENTPASSAPIHEHPSLATPPSNYYPTVIQEGETKPSAAPYSPSISSGQVYSPTIADHGETNSFDRLRTSSVPSALQQNYGREEDYSKESTSVFQIEVERIFPNPHQPRRHFDEGSLSELANSIREFGIIQPLIVTKLLKETEEGTEVTYQLIAGERRLLAAKKVGLRTVPVIIKRVGMDRERLELAIIENIQREDLNPLEAARGYARLQDEFGLTQREIAIRIGKSRETIANALRLLNLPSEIQQALEDGRINESHARLLLQINDIARQKDMLQSILRVKPSVRELKATIKREKTGFPGKYLNPELISLQLKLEESLGTKAKIDDNGGEGKITINYYSPEELSALINKLSGEDF